MYCSTSNATPITTSKDGEYERILHFSFLVGSLRNKILWHIKEQELWKHCNENLFHNSDSQVRAHDLIIIDDEDIADDLMSIRCRIPPCLLPHADRLFNMLTDYLSQDDPRALLRTNA